MIMVRFLLQLQQALKISPLLPIIIIITTIVARMGRQP